MATTLKPPITKPRMSSGGSLLRAKSELMLAPTSTEELLFIFYLYFQQGIVAIDLLCYEHVQMKHPPRIVANMQPR
jgi:hypothetical protein